MVFVVSHGIAHWPVSSTRREVSMAEKIRSTCVKISKLPSFNTWRNEKAHILIRSKYSLSSPVPR
jgi:hypothetical protein